MKDLSTAIDDNHVIWTGKWKSSIVGVKGNLAVKLPDPIPNGREFDAKTIVTYKWFLFPMGDMSIDLIGKFDSSGISSDKSDETGQQIYQISFKGKVPNSKQTIEYIATIDDKKSIIVGGYKSYSPNDIGTFTIKKRL